MPRNYVNPNRMIPEVNQTLPVDPRPTLGVQNPVTPTQPINQMAVPNAQANNIINGTTNSANRMQGSKQRTQSDMVNQLNGRRRPVRTRAFNAMNRMRGNAMRGYS